MHRNCHILGEDMGRNEDPATQQPEFREISIASVDNRDRDRPATSRSGRRHPSDTALVAGTLAAGLAVALSGVEAAAQNITAEFVPLWTVGGIQDLMVNADGSLSITLTNGQEYVLPARHMMVMPSGEIAISTDAAIFLQEALSLEPAPAAEPSSGEGPFAEFFPGLYGEVALPLGLVLGGWRPRNGHGMLRRGGQGAPPRVVRRHSWRGAREQVDAHDLSLRRGPIVDGDIIDDLCANHADIARAAFEAAAPDA